ncbi:nucleotidyltransferase substrate binding protein [Orrella daihaiensis]|uniref:Nucleotidyltransferase substrate binding protein n=1 Tax=Orrella daihaiensis TaxID=2782176 RepID=A0ABY4AJI4_9BURK|nr:nucleotidyltransferase substrate binding protein [Orrella daihaiensis]UOD50451.1 nucleotidyltransferase substrate binding protein [Orrella daihaiensis]
MSDQDIRWKQRFVNFKKAHVQLKEALTLMQQRPLTNLEKQGVIKGFEFIYELSWKVLRDYLIWQGVASIAGSRDAIREAFKLGLISDGHAWMEMLKDRNNTVHIYDEATVSIVLDNLKQRYAVLFNELEEQFDRLSNISS